MHVIMKLKYQWCSQRPGIYILTSPTQKAICFRLQKTCICHSNSQQIIDFTFGKFIIMQPIFHARLWIYQHHNNSLCHLKMNKWSTPFASHKSEKLSHLRLENKWKLSKTYCLLGILYSLGSKCDLIKIKRLIVQHITLTFIPVQIIWRKCACYLYLQVSWNAYAWAEEVEYRMNSNISLISIHMDKPINHI